MKPTGSRSDTLEVAKLLRVTTMLAEVIQCHHYEQFASVENVFGEEVVEIAVGLILRGLESDKNFSQ